MNMFEDHPKLAIGMVVLVSGGCLGVSQLIKRHNERMRIAVEETEAGGAPRVPETERLKELRPLEYKEPDRALVLVEAIVAAPESPAELDAAKQKHANILQLCFYERIKAGRRDEAREYLDRLRAEYPEAHQVQGAERSWADAEKKRCRDHLQAGRVAEAHAVLEALSAEDLLFGDERILEEYQRTLAESWVQAGQPVESMQTLVEAARVLARVGPGSPLATVFQGSEVGASKLLELANAQGQGDERFAAIPLYQAVVARLHRGNWHGNGQDLSHEQKQALLPKLEHRLATLIGELGGAMEAGQRPLITACGAEDLYRQAAAAMQTPALRAYLVRLQIRLETNRLLELSDPVLAHSLDSLAGKRLPSDEHNALSGVLRESSNLARAILHQSGAQLWAIVVRDPKFDPWPLLPAVVRAEFDERRRKGTSDESLRQSLGSHAGREEFAAPLPELEPVRQRAAEINARRGLIVHAVQPAECVHWLRVAWRQNVGAEFRARVTEAISQALAHSRGAGQFDAFYELTRFLVGEVGLEQLPPGRREEFRSALGEVAEELAARERPKAIFLWTVQAEACAGRPDGEQARARAMDAAYLEVERVPLTEVAAETLPPSGRPGVSVLSIDNSTSYHLLVFYRGPESFTLACRPYQKLSALTQNGHYDVAVITPSGEILPYRGKVSLKESWQRSNYRVGTEGESEKFGGQFASTASGAYQLAYRAPGFESLEIDSRTGGLLRK